MLTAVPVAYERTIKVPQVTDYGTVYCDDIWKEQAHLSYSRQFCNEQEALDGQSESSFPNLNAVSECREIGYGCHIYLDSRHIYIDRYLQQSEFQFYLIILSTYLFSVLLWKQ